MIVRINNKETELTDGMTIANLATTEKLPEKGVAIAVNNEIVPRTKWNEHTINNGDDIIILKAFCGG